MLELYENIKRLRKENGWSQEELAKKAGYTDRSSIAKIEKGLFDLPQSKIFLFADIFGIDAGTLMGTDGVKGNTGLNKPSLSTGPVQLTPDEKSHIETFRLLNRENQTKVARYTDSLLDVQQMEEEPMLLAAHRRTDITDEEYEAAKDHDLEIMKELVKGL